MKNKIIKYSIFLLAINMFFANSRVAFSRPATVLRTPSVQILDSEKKPYLFTAGFATETVNFDLPSTSTSLYFHTQTSNDFNIGLSYTSLADPRSTTEIDEDSTSTYMLPTEIGLHIQKRIYQAGNIHIDLGISDIMARKWNGKSEFQNPSMYAVFSSHKVFDKFAITYNFGFGSGKVASDQHTTDFDQDEVSNIGYFLGFNLLTPEIPRLKNRLNLLFELDGTSINLGAKLPITDEYVISMGVVNFSEMGDFGNRSKVGQTDAVISPDAPTICFGFEMNVPKLNKRQLSGNPYYSSNNPDQIFYTEEAVNQLQDSLNNVINTTQKKYDSIADSIRFLTFSLENNETENTSLQQKIASLEDSLYQQRNQKTIDITNYNKASRHISRALRYFYEQDYNNALIETDKAIEINPNLAIAYARKGTIYYSIGQIQSASINWNIALKLDPEYDEVRDILEALKDNKLKSAELEEDN